MHVQKAHSDAELISRNLAAAREALIESQRLIANGSTASGLVQDLIGAIDSLSLSLRAADASSTVPKISPYSGARVTRMISRCEDLFWEVPRRGSAGASLGAFAARVLKKGRIGKFDVQALQREILADGITSRAEADVLIALDRKLDSLHFSWSSFFISAIAEFVVWRSGTMGCIDEDEARWLGSALGGGNTSDRARRVLLAVAREADCPDETFVSATTRRSEASRLTMNDAELTA